VYVRSLTVLPLSWTLNGTPSHDWGKFMATKRKELKRLNDIHSNMLDKVSLGLGSDKSPALHLAILPTHVKPKLCRLD